MFILYEYSYIYSVSGSSLKYLINVKDGIYLKIYDFYAALANFIMYLF